MERRGFLKGLFGGITAAGVIVAASPAEIEAFASPLLKDAPVVLDVPTPRAGTLAAGEHLYNAQGELVAIVSEIHLSRFESGAPVEVDIRAHGLGPVRFRGSL